jgi:hypothetical protein
MASQGFYSLDESDHAKEEGIGGELRGLVNLIFLTKAQHSDGGAPKVTANPHLAFDIEEHFKKLAEV